MKTKEKGMLIILLAVVMSLSAGVQAVVVTFHNEQPTPDLLDISNFVGATRDANNVGTATTDGAFNDATTYVAFDRGSQGQTFVTGSSKPVYQVTGFWLKQCGYSAPPNTVATWWNFLNGSTLTVRVTIPAASGTPGFVMSSETYTITGSEQNKPASGTGNSLTGPGVWVHAVLATPIPVGPNRTYGVDMTAAGGGFFETYGIKDSAPNGNPYTAGTAYVSGASGVGGNVLTVAPGDRVFIVELLAEAPLTASVPYPDVNATGVPQNLTLTWVPGKYADKHDIYFGTDKTKVTNANRTNQMDVLVSQNQGPNSYPVSGLVSGTTYYWRIDEVNNNAGAPAGSPWKGTVWRFTLMPTKAWAPSPYDGEICVFDSPKPTLYWNAGYNSTKSKVYFGTNPASLALKTTITHTANVRYSYQVTDTINKNTYYYWRIDEVQPDTSTITGDPWQFKTIPNIPVTDPNLKGWWKFDEGPGKAIDWSGLNQHGTVYGGATSVAGYDEGAIKFDGLDGEVSLPIGSTISNLHSATIATWVNFSGGGAFQRIFDFGNNPGTGVPTVYMYLMAANAGGVPQFGITTTGAAGESTIVGSYALPTGVWHHVAVTINAGTDTARLYLDGVQVVENPAVTLEPNNLGDTNDNNLGKSKFWDPPNPHFNGSLDDFRIYNKVLTQEEIKVAMRGNALLAWNPSPTNNSIIDIEKAVPISWSAGDKAVQHDVYFGTDPNAVADAGTLTAGIYRGRQSGTSYNPPAALVWGQTYYWRIDEYNTDATISTGRIWSFTVADFVLVDDFEDYNNFTPDRVFQTWLDGIGYSAELPYFPTGYPGNGTGAAVGHDIWSTGTPYTTIMETSIINGGGQSMPVDYNNHISPYYSETTRIFPTSQDWTRSGVKALSLWFMGIPASVGSLKYDQATGTYTMTGSGADIWNTADQFHFAYKTLTGDCTIIARIDSITNTNAQAKAGVMIRDTLDPGSPLVDAVVSADNRVMFQWRETQGANMNSPESSTHTVAGAFTLPHWIKLTRSGFVFTVQHSADGVTWQDIVPETAGDPLSMAVNMNTTVFIGLAVTSHNTSATCEAKISNVSITVPNGSSYSPAGPFTVSQDIGIASNDPAPMYVTLEDDTGGKNTVNHPDDPNAVLQGTWQEWNILLSQFTGVKLDKIKKMTIGTGNKTAGGSGSLYFDDIRLYKSRCVPLMAKPAGDLNDDCMVDYLDVDILAGDWLLVDEVIATTPPSTTGLMGHWKFDGNANDSSGNGRNGTVNGSPQWAPVGHIDGALSFDGTDDYVDLPIGPVIASMESCTIATWVNFSNTGGGWQRIFDFGSDPNFYMFLSPRTGTTGPMRFAITTTGSGGAALEPSQLNAPSTLATGWHHVAVMIDGVSKNMQLYLDGVSIVSGTTQTLPKDLGNTTQNWLGRSQYATDAYLTGSLDDFRIYNRVLSKSEIAYLADSTPGDGQLYVPLVSDADLYSTEAAGSRKVNFKDFAVLAATWLEEKLWP